MSSNIASINAMFIAVSNMGKGSGYTPRGEDPEDNKDDENVGLIFICVIIASLLLVAGIILTGEKKEDKEVETKYAQVRGVGYYAMNYYGKYNSVVFLGDTSDITKDSAVKLMENYSKRGQWFLEIKEYYKTIDLKQIEDAKQTEIARIEAEKKRAIVADCLGRKFMDYNCEYKGEK